MLGAAVQACEHEPVSRFSPDQRQYFTLSCDGWVRKYEAGSQKELGHARAGSRSRNFAISADGKWLAVANTAPTTLTILATADLSVAKLIEVKGDDGTPSRLSGVYNNPPRESFILALMDAPKIWEVFYGANPPAFGFAHDWRMEGPVSQKTPFPIRKITTTDILGNFGFDPSYEYVLAAARLGGGVVIDLVIGQKVADLDLPENPQFSEGVIHKHGDGYVLTITHLGEAVTSLIEMKTWELIEVSDR
ncbi:cytochrome D1 domain-containing protein [Profundibacter sp.]